MATCVLAFSAGAGMTTVQSSTDSNGFYSYTLTCGDEPYWFGGDSNVLGISVLSRAIVAIFDPPGWSSSTDTQSRITWRRSDGTAWLCGTNAVTFSLTSSIKDPVLYDEPIDSTAYPRGTVVGEVYGTNGILFNAPSTNGTASANVVGYETFPFVGPAVPEPCLLAALCALLFGSLAADGNRKNAKARRA